MKAYSCFLISRESGTWMGHAALFIGPRATEMADEFVRQADATDGCTATVEAGESDQLRPRHTTDEVVPAF